MTCYLCGGPGADDHAPRNVTRHPVAVKWFHRDCMAARNYWRARKRQTDEAKRWETAGQMKWEV